MTTRYRKEAGNAPGLFFDSARSNLHHFFHAVPTQNIDLFCGPDGLPAPGTNQLAGGAGPLASWGGRSRLSCTAGPRSHGRGEGVAAYPYLVPALGQSVLYQPVAGPGVPPSRPALEALQPPLLGLLFEFPVVIPPASGYLFNTVLPAIEVHHLVEHGIQRLLDWVVEDFGGDVQLIGLVIFPLPDLGDGTMSHCPRLGLYCDNRCGQRPLEKVTVEAIINVFQLTD